MGLSVANEHKQFIGVRHFLEHTTHVLHQQASCVALTTDLLAILVHDAWFGAKDLSQLMFAGRNTYLNLFDSPPEHIS